MKYSFLLFVFFVMVLIIAACMASETYAPSKPGVYNSAASQKARADNTMQQAQQQEANADAAAVDETAQAQVSASANSPSKQTAQAIEAIATADARAMLLAQQQEQTTATAEAMSVRQTVQAIEAKATVDARAILLAQQQVQATATAEAMQRDVVTRAQAASSAQRRSELMAWFIPIVAVMAFGLVLFVGAKFINGMIDEVNERRNLENQRLALPGPFYETSTETTDYVDVPQTGYTPPIPLNIPGSNEGYGTITSHRPIIDAEVPPVPVAPSNDDKAQGDAEVSEEAARFKLAMRLLRDAINHVGTESNRIPSAAQLGWQAETWTIAVAILRPFGVEILPGTDGDTYLVGQYPTLPVLYAAIGERRLKLYPTSAERISNG